MFLATAFWGVGGVARRSWEEMRERGMYKNIIVLMVLMGRVSMGKALVVGSLKGEKSGFAPEKMCWCSSSRGGRAGRSWMGLALRR